jgi:hypothetical protein
MVLKADKNENFQCANYTGSRAGSSVDRDVKKRVQTGSGQGSDGWLEESTVPELISLPNNFENKFF